ncbi:MAG: ferric iron uptake transcriptional regulator [Gammaproteobacteria bacterium]|nr:ferric iron uptake transcriptional regulator [Gammaproteobacteria bacterium]
MYRQDLRRAGLKVTLPRIKILDILNTSERQHLNAEAVYHALMAAGEDIGIATVYRVLNQLENVGLVTRHHFSEGGKAVYEIAHDTHHDHLICSTCGAVIEFKDDALQRRQKQLAEKLGFQVEDYSLIIRAKCTKKNCTNAKRIKRFNNRNELNG